MGRRGIDYRYDLKLRFEAETLYVGLEEPSRFSFHYRGSILLYNDDRPANVDKFPRRFQIGTFSAFVVDSVSAAAESESLFDIFDSHQATIKYWETLYKNGDFKTSVIDAIDGYDWLWNPNLLILDRLEIVPEHRGHGAGLLVLKALIHRLRPGIGLVAMKPFPLQFESRHLDDSTSEERNQLGLDGFKLSQAKATAKLREYYGRLGFKRVPRTEYMVRSAEIPLPSDDELLSRSEYRAPSCGG